MSPLAQKLEDSSDNTKCVGGGGGIIIINDVIFWSPTYIFKYLRLAILFRFCTLQNNHLLFLVQRTNKKHMETHRMELGSLFCCFVKSFISCQTAQSKMIAIRDTNLQNTFLSGQSDFFLQYMK